MNGGAWLLDIDCADSGGKLDGLADFGLSFSEVKDSDILLSVRKEAPGATCAGGKVSS